MSKSLESFLGRPLHGYSNPPCHVCGERCSGEKVKTVVIVDDLTAEKPVCDRHADE